MTSSGAAASNTKRVTFNGVQVSIPRNWPVIDGGHARNLCSSTFLSQADRVFLGPSYQGVPACPAPIRGTRPLPADGVWMQPALRAPAGPPAPTTLPGGQRVYLSTLAQTASVRVWYHRVSIQIGIGANPAVEHAILESITYRPAAANTAVLGRCPPRDPAPAMPEPARVSAPLVLDGDNGQMLPEPANIHPKVSAASVWKRFFRDFGVFSGALDWSITFGGYSAQTPARIKPDSSSTPKYQGLPTWLIRGTGAPTVYGPCGITVLAPYDADTGRGMGVTTIG